MELDARVVADQEFAKGWTETARKLREYDQLLSDVRTLQACHEKQDALRNCQENGGFDKCYSEYMAALDNAEQSGALTRWRDDAKPL